MKNQYRIARFCELCSRYHNDPSASTNLVLARDNANAQALQALETLSENPLLQTQLAETCYSCDQKQPRLVDALTRLNLIGPKVIPLSEIMKNPKLIASICDHTSLQPPESKKYQIPGKNPVEERRKDLENFMQNAINNPLGFYAVCIRGCETSIGRKMIDESKSKLVLAVTTGFPNLEGNLSLESTLEETKKALDEGADEIDSVLNWKSYQMKMFEANEKMDKVNDLVKKRGKIHKVILEICKLDSFAISACCYNAKKFGVDFVKTSTGFAESGATPEALRVMKENFPRGIKAAGGINMKNLPEILTAMSGRQDGSFELNPKLYRIGESSLFNDIGDY